MFQQKSDKTPDYRDVIVCGKLRFCDGYIVDGRSNRGINKSAFHFFDLVLMLPQISFIALTSDLLIIAPAGPEAKTRGGIIVSPAYTYKRMCEYWCSMSVVCESIPI